MARKRSGNAIESTAVDPVEVMRELVARDPRSPRRISLAAGLSADAVRLALQGRAAPRTKTLIALARSLGVDPRVLSGEMPIPELGQPETAPSARNKTSATEQRRALRSAIRTAMRAALRGGLPPSVALLDAVQAALLSAVAAGLDEIEAAQVVGAIGLPE